MGKKLGAAIIVFVIGSFAIAGTFQSLWNNGWVDFIGVLLAAGLAVLAYNLA